MRHSKDKKFQNYKTKLGNFQKINIVVILICLLPIIVSIIYVFYFGVNVTFGDQWETVVIIDKITSGNFKFYDLLLPHNEHIIFFPHIFILLLGFITKFNNLVEMFVVIFLLMISFLIFCLYFKKKLYFNKNFFWLIPISFLLFNLKQYVNLLWGWQITFLFIVVFSLAAFYLIYLSSEVKKIKGSIGIFTGAIVCGTVTAYSSSMGLLLWPAGLLQILLSPYAKRRKLFYSIIWSVIGAMEWLLFFKLCGSNIYIHKSNFFPPDISVLKKFFTIIGSSLLWDKNRAFILGLIIFSLILLGLIILIRNKKVKENSFLIAVLSFSILVSLLIVFSGRNPSPSRYATFTVLIIISIYSIFLDLNVSFKSIFFKIVIGVIIGIIFLNIPIIYYRAIIEGKKIKEYREKAAFILTTYDQQPDESLKILYPPSADKIKIYAPILEKLNYNVFSGKHEFLKVDDLIPNEDSTFYNIDKVLLNNVITKQQKQFFYRDLENEFIIISGWALDSSTEDLASEVYIEIDGIIYPSFYGIERKDIADSFKNKNYRYSGFERAIKLADIGSGLHKLKLIIISKDGKTYFKTEDYEIELIEYTAYSEIIINDNLKLNSKDESKFIIQIDSPSNNSRVFEDKIIIDGWAVDTVDLNNNGNLQIIFYDGPELKDYNYLGKIEHYLIRDDVANYLGIDEYRYSGFKFQLDTLKMGNGIHDIYIYVIDKDGIYSDKILRLEIIN